MSKVSTVMTAKGRCSARVIERILGGATLVRLDKGCLPKIKPNDEEIRHRFRPANLDSRETLQQRERTKKVLNWILSKNNAKARHLSTVSSKESDRRCTQVILSQN